MSALSKFYVHCLSALLAHRGKSCAAALIAVIFSGISAPALAQTVIVANLGGTSPYGVVTVSGQNPVLYLTTKSLATRVAAIVNQMATAAGDCNRLGYFAAGKEYLNLEQSLDKGSADYNALKQYAQYLPFLNPWFCPEQPAGQWFVGFNFGGGFQGTNFSVDPSFNVNGDGLVAGGFGGIFFPIPNTTAQAGFRFGWEGGNIVGTTNSPQASPLFNYSVRTDSMFYQDGLIKIPVRSGVVSGFDVTLGAGLAEMHSTVHGLSDSVSAYDNTYRPGVTFTVGASTLLGVLPNGIGVNGFLQWRGTQWSSSASIPGSVPISSFTNEVGVGLDFGPVDLSRWASESGVDVFSRLGFRIWGPEAPQP